MCIRDTRWQSIKATRHISYPPPDYLFFRTSQCLQSFNSLNPEYVCRDTSFGVLPLRELAGTFLK